MQQKKQSHAELVSASSRSINGFTSRRHPELDSGSRCYQYGFTLIELLVVVIIIAVLAAVAVPQYKKAVLKSRFSTVMPAAKAVADAQEVYYLGNGQYALSKDYLDVVQQDVENTAVALSTADEEDSYNYVVAKRTDYPNARYIVYQKHSPKFAGNIHCEAKADDTEALWLCEKGLGGVEVKGGGSIQGGEYKTYLLAGSQGEEDSFASDGGDNEGEGGNEGGDTGDSGQGGTEPTPVITRPLVGEPTCEVWDRTGENCIYKYQDGGSMEYFSHPTSDMYYYCSNQVCGSSQGGGSGGFSLLRYDMDSKKYEPIFDGENMFNGLVYTAGGLRYTYNGAGSLMGIETANKVWIGEDFKRSWISSDEVDAAVLAEANAAAQNMVGKTMCQLHPEITQCQQ